MEQPTRFIGMDVHKDTIAVAMTAAGDAGKVHAHLGPAGLRLGHRLSGSTYRENRHQHVDPQPLGNPQRFRICVDELIQPTLQFSFVTNKVLISSLFEVYYCNVWEIKKCNFLLRA
jgi:hypothetical protein